MSLSMSILVRSCLLITLIKCLKVISLLDRYYIWWCFSKVSCSQQSAVSQSVSDKGTYWAVWRQIKYRGVHFAFKIPLFYTFYTENVAGHFLHQQHYQTWICWVINFGRVRGGKCWTNNCCKVYPERLEFIFLKGTFPKCTFPKCIFPKCIFQSFFPKE